VLKPEYDDDGDESTEAVDVDAVTLGSITIVAGRPEGVSVSPVIPAVTVIIPVSVPDSDKPDGKILELNSDPIELRFA